MGSTPTLSTIVIGFNMNFPTTCIDNFYSDPYAVRQLALSLQYEKPIDGTYPGKRTELLHLIEPKFFNDFCEKLLSAFFDFDVHDVKYKILTSFQIIEPYSNKIDSPKNKGWVHYDRPMIFGGIIYLNTKFNADGGTCIFLEKNLDVFSTNKEKMLTHDKVKSKYYSDRIDNNFNYHWKQNNENFIESAKFSSVFNRLVAFDGNTAHAANNMHFLDEPRLTQTFFVEQLEVNSLSPIERLKKIPR